MHLQPVGVKTTQRRLTDKMLNLLTATPLEQYYSNTICLVDMITVDPTKCTIAMNFLVHILVNIILYFLMEQVKSKDELKGLVQVETIAIDMPQHII